MNANKILVVEDAEPLIEVIKAMLEKSKLEMVSARSVKEALEFLQEGEKIDAIWLDHYLLGKENGLDLVAKIKEESSPWKSLPIFVVSNTATAAEVESYLRLGAVKFYTKVDTPLQKIVEDIKNFLEKGQ